MPGLTQMLWNSDTVDSCFLSPGWRVTSKGMFAVSCISVVLFVIFFEYLHRFQRNYDAFLVKQYRKENAQVRSSSHEKGSEIGPLTDIQANSTGNNDSNLVPAIPKSPEPGSAADLEPQRLVPTKGLQAIRALSRKLQFAVGYPATSKVVKRGSAADLKPLRLVPTIGQRAIRALLHMLQFAVGYLIMLFAMSYNGWIILSIVGGAAIGAFIFSGDGISNH